MYRTDLLLTFQFGISLAYRYPSVKLVYAVKCLSLFDINLVQILVSVIIIVPEIFSAIFILS